jgi:hypothetical protein
MKRTPARWVWFAGQLAARNEGRVWAVVMIDKAERPCNEAEGKFLVALGVGQAPHMMSCRFGKASLTHLMLQ